MNALVIALHGNRAAAANEALERLALRASESCGGRWGAVKLGFLQFGSPLLDEVLEQLASEGAERITVVPLFLGTGRHVAVDLPAAVSACATKHPTVEILTAPHLGAWEGLAGAVVALAVQSEENAATT